VHRKEWCGPHRRKYDALMGGSVGLALASPTPVSIDVGVWHLRAPDLGVLFPMSWLEAAHRFHSIWLTEWAVPFLLIGALVGRPRCTDWVMCHHC